MVSCIGSLSAAWFIIKPNIFDNRRSEFFFRAVFCSVKLLALHIWKEALHDGVVIRNVRSWKWLCNPELFQIVPKRFGSVITSVVGMKNQVLIRMPRFIGKLESALCQLSAVFTSYHISYNLSCVQVDDNTNIIIFLVIPKAGNIADPHLIRARRIELLIQIILVYKC